MIQLHSIKQWYRGNTIAWSVLADFGDTTKTYTISSSGYAPHAQQHITSAFLPLIILEAIERESDIYLSDIISEDIKFILNDYLLPVLSKAFNKRKICVIAESVPTDISKNCCACTIAPKDVSDKIKLDTDTFSCSLEISSQIEQTLFADNTFVSKLMKIFSAGLFVAEKLDAIILKIPQACGQLNYISNNILKFLPMLARGFSNSYLDFIIDCRTNKTTLHNSKKIVIGPIRQYQHKKCTRIESEIDFNGTSKPLYFETSQENASFLVSDRIDSFVVMVLAEALRCGYDIESNEPISWELKKKLELFLIPTLTKGIDAFHPVVLNMPVIRKCVKHNPSNCCGTGFSGGIDSMYTLSKYYNRSDKYKISHLSIFNAGVFEVEDPKKLYNTAKNNITNYAKSIELSVAGLSSNYDDIIRVPYYKECPYRLLACALALGGLWDTYFLSSAFPFRRLGFSENWPDCYEILLVYSFSTHYLTFLLCGEGKKRIEKLSFLADTDSKFRNYIHPCVHNPIFGTENCGTCLKCIRAVYTLDKLGKLKNCSVAFPTDYYFAHKAEIEAKILFSSKINSFDEELFEDDSDKVVTDEVRRRVQGLSAIEKLIHNNRKDFVDKGKNGGIITEKYIYE